MTLYDYIELYGIDIDVTNYSWIDDVTLADIVDECKLKYRDYEVIEVDDKALNDALIGYTFNDKDYYYTELLKTLEVNYNLLERTKMTNIGTSNGTGTANTTSSSNGEAVGFVSAYDSSDFSNKDKNTSSDTTTGSNSSTTTASNNNSTVGYDGNDLEEIIRKRREIINISMKEMIVKDIINSICYNYISMI